MLGKPCFNDLNGELIWSRLGIFGQRTDTRLYASINLHFEHRASPFRRRNI